MNLHPTVIAAHIADTTASACRQRPPRMSRSLHIAIALAVVVLFYFGVRMA
jgi:hypothetical protein